MARPLTVGAAADRAGVCAACGYPVREHYDHQNNFVSCAWVKAKYADEAETPGFLITTYDRAGCPIDDYRVCKPCWSQHPITAGRQSNGTRVRVDLLTFPRQDCHWCGEHPEI